MRLENLRWVAGKVDFWGRNLGQSFRWQFWRERGKVQNKAINLGKGGHVEFWLELDYSAKMDQLEVWRKQRVLGTLIVPITARGVTVERSFRL